MNDEEPIDGLIYCTDLEGSFPRQAPTYPVLWCTLGDQPHPFGEILQIGD